MSNNRPDHGIWIAKNMPSLSFSDRSAIGPAENGGEVVSLLFLGFFRRSAGKRTPAHEVAGALPERGKVSASFTLWQGNGRRCKGPCHAALFSTRPYEILFLSRGACRLKSTVTAMNQKNITGHIASLQGVLFCLLVLFHFMPPPSVQAEGRPIKIGVLAIRGAEQCLKTWAPTADYLTERIPGQTFVIVPLAHDRIGSSVRDREVDFILSNSSFYVELEQGYGINRIASLKELRLGRVYSKYGSVIFSRAARTDIRTLADLKGKSFMAVSENSLGGWQMAWRELKENGIDPYSDFRSLQFGETHDSVVYAVLDGQVDIGTVRTNTLEELSAEGKITLSDFFVFPRLHDRDVRTPYLCTTREYPDWPMAKVKETPDELAEKVAVALIQMRPDSPAAIAAGCGGWTIPLNYQPVMDLMMALRVGPYKDLGKITIADIVRNYGPWIIVAFIFFCSHALFTVLVMKLNRRIKASHYLLTGEIELHKKLDKELEQAKQQAEAATLAKSRFLANMSHEIRTPMNGIIAATDLALAETLAPEVEHYLHIVQNSSYSLLGIINDILDFSKIEAGQLELKKRVFRLDEMFDRVMDVFVNQAAEKDIEMLVDIDANTPRILRGDCLRLQQILTNLIGNSIKFTAPGGIILVSVRDSRIAEGLNGDQVMLAFAVKDTGTGISPQYLPLLFEPFTQGDSSSTRKYEGTGLGLSICKKFVTMMHGSIGVDSVAGQGSTFSFTVRLEKSGGSTVSRFVFPPDLRGLKVLVVDDCADSREIMAKMLASLDFRVETVSSGMAAIDRLRGSGQNQGAVDLVLMDWKMPEMDGIEASRRIRVELMLTQPIIMMTAFAREVHRSTAEKVGTNGFLTKPIFQSTLFDAIMDAFGKEGSRKGSAARAFTTKASMYKKHLKGCNILVAEDNLTNQQVAKAILGGAGIIVTMVGNGEEAVAEAAKGPFDAVLMDIQMPKMNGFEATKQIRLLPGCTTLPIIAMTAHALKGDEEKCLEAGMDGYVAKPINQDRLFYTIWRLLLNRKKVVTPPPLTRVNDEDQQLLGEEEDELLLVEDPDDSLSFQLPGIDVGAVLQSTGLNWRTFQDVLVGFFRDNRNTVATIDRALAANDRAALLHLAHSLKGSAANIGAGELREVADDLEQGCNNHLPAAAVASLCQELQKELTRLLGVLEQIVGEQADEGEKILSLAAEGDIMMLLTTLTEAIDRADPEEIQMITAQVIGRLADHQSVNQATLNTLETETRRYDYDQALKTIEILRKAMEGQQ
jgi:signal transduction histidine kinase/DNA-binding response OmpR family regulator/HPt (histidine-containing phosphotransfer) domain-containing protein